MSEEKEINSDLIYFFNICNLIQTPDDEKSNQLRIELDNQVSMYELTKEIECKDTGRKYRLHIKHYGEFGDTHMVDIHWKYQNPDEHTWNILNVLTVRFNKNKQLYRIINDTYKEKIDNPLRFALIDWRDNMTTNFEMQRVRMFLDHFIDQIMHCSVNGNAMIQCKKETGYTRCVWMIPSLCNPDRKEIAEKEEPEKLDFESISNDDPDSMTDLDFVLSALRLIHFNKEDSSEPFEIKENDMGSVIDVNIEHTFETKRNLTYRFKCQLKIMDTLQIIWEVKKTGDPDNSYVKLNCYRIQFNSIEGNELSIIRVRNEIYDYNCSDPLSLSDLDEDDTAIINVSSFMRLIKQRLLSIADKKYVTMRTENMASIKTGGVWKEFRFEVWEDNLLETIIAWHDLYQLKINESNNIGIFDSVEALKKLKEEIKLKKNIAALYETHTRDELMEEEDMKKELVNGMRVESDINKLIDLVTRNEHGEMELAQVREDPDHPEKQYKLIINRDYDKNRLIFTYAEFSDKTFDASKPNEITQIIVSFYKGIFTDGGAKDSIEKIKIKTTIQDYKALKQFLADEHDNMHINKIMKFAYARLSPLKISVEQATYHKMLKKYQGKD